MDDPILWFLVIAALAAGVAGIILGVAAFLPNVRESIVGQLGGQELWLAAFLSVATMIGSLYLSEAKEFIPCEFCWYQRIAAYPLAVLFVMAAIRRDRTMFTYSLGLAIPGALLSLYHIAKQNISALQGTGSCDPANPCDIKWIDELGFVSIPVMALGSFLFIIGLSVMSIAHDRSTVPNPSEET